MGLGSSAQEKQEAFGLAENEEKLRDPGHRWCRGKEKENKVLSSSLCTQSNSLGCPELLHRLRLHKDIQSK